MRIGVIGAGNVGTTLAKRLIPKGHEVMLSYSRDAAKLEAAANTFGASMGSPADATRFGEVVVLTVPWSAVEDALTAWLAYKERAYEVEIFSPDGGECKADAMSDPRDSSGYSADDLISMGFISTPSLGALLQSTRNVEEMRIGEFDAIVVAGGQAPMFSFETATGLHEKFIRFYEAGRIAAALCHGTAILRFARLSNGKPLVAGKTVTGFANIEEDFADAAVWEMNALPRGHRLMPWRIEDELKVLGANYVKAGLWRGFAVRDGNLITGQQNFSGAETAAKVIEALGG